MSCVAASRGSVVEETQSEGIRGVTGVQETTKI
ncbi:hypothetical protein MY3296_004962 [Beauveria thailandica]